MLEKAENSFQEYDLLYYEIKSLKQNLINKGKKINQEILQSILKIKNPNDGIYFMIKMFYRIINSIKKEKNQKKFEWEYIQQNLTINSILLYLSIIAESDTIHLNKEELDDAMPFLINYDKLKNIYSKIMNNLTIILDFIKVSVEFNIKLNIMKNLYTGNLKKNTKIEILQSEMNKRNSLRQKSKLILLQIIKDYNNFKELSNEDKKMIDGYSILEKYSLFEKYTVENEKIYDKNDTCTIKFIIKLNKKYREKENFISQLSESLISYGKGIRKINEKKFYDYIKIAQKKRNVKGRNYYRAFDSNSIKEEELPQKNFIHKSKALIDIANKSNIDELKINNTNIIDKKQINGIITQNKQNFKLIKNPPLNLVKVSNETFAYEQTKNTDGSYISKQKYKTNEIFTLKNISSSQKNLIIPQGQASITLEKEEKNTNYYYLCCKK